MFPLFNIYVHFWELHYPMANQKKKATLPGILLAQRPVKTWPLYMESGHPTIIEDSRIPSDNFFHSYGTSPSFIGESTIKKYEKRSVTIYLT